MTPLVYDPTMSNVPVPDPAVDPDVADPDNPASDPDPDDDDTDPTPPPRKSARRKIRGRASARSTPFFLVGLYCPRVHGSPPLPVGAVHP